MELYIEELKEQEETGPMDIQVSTIKLYELIRAKADQKTAEEIVSALQESIKDEVKQEATNQRFKNRFDRSD